MLNFPEEIQKFAFELATLPSKNCTSGKFCKIMFGTNQKNLQNAILADIIDAIPIIGDVSNVSRIMNSSTGKYVNKKRLSLRTFDLLGDAIGGGLLDLLLPSNTIIYLEGKKSEKSNNVVM